MTFVRISLDDWLVSSTAPGWRFEMKCWIFLVVALSFGAAVLCAMDNDQGDTIQILAIYPSGPVKRGVAVEFKIDA